MNEVSDNIAVALKSDFKGRSLRTNGAFCMYELPNRNLKVKFELIDGNFPEKLYVHESFLKSLWRVLKDASDFMVKLFELQVKHDACKNDK